MSHYIYGSGEYGCLFDNGPHCAETLKDAVESLAFTFELGRDRKRQLKHDWWLELNPRRDGAQYCSIDVCNCGKPESHEVD